MARNKNGLSSLVNRLNRTSVNGLNVSKSLKPTTPTGSSSSNKTIGGRPPSLGDVRALSLSGKNGATGIKFARASDSRTSNAGSASAWTHLLTQSASGGVASALTGGLSSILGLGGLFSGIASLFGGGKSTPPPLVDFQLPNSVSQTVYVSSKGSTAYQGSAVERPAASGTAGNQTSGGQQIQYQSAAIAQAVKTALLNSSSLNDVIAEI